MQEAANHSAGTANYTWTGIIEFLQEQLNQNTIRQNEWLLEKQHLQTKLGKTEGELRATEQINADLVKRVKMLEFCLRQERVKYSALLSNKKITIPELKNNNETPTLNQSAFINPTNSKRKTKGSRNTILKFLEEVGYDDVPLDDNLALGERGLSIRNEVSQSQRNDISEPFYKYTDEADRSEQISVLDNSAFKKLDKSRDHQYGRSGEEKSYRTKTTSDKANHAEITPSVSHPDFVPIKTDFLSQDKQQEWQQKCTLKGHFDGIRDIFVNSSDSIVASVSEDCVIKVWDLKKLKKLSNNPSASLDSYLTLREHTGLLFAVTGPQMENFDPLNKRLLYTAGSEGIIRVWDLPLSSECETYPTNPRSYCLTTLNAHEDSIWELTHHPFKHSIMSTSSDGFIKICETLNSNGDVSGKIKAQFSQKISGSDEPEYLVPTSATWIHSRINQVAAGYANLSSLVLFDEETGRNVGSLRYKSTHQDFRFSQPNKVISHPNMSLLIAGHEDKHLRFFDPNTNKQVHTILAHHDSVTNVCYQANTTNLLSVSHDGSLKIWDLRKYGLVQEISGIHLKKYDEQIHCVASDENSQLILTGGADGLVSVIERIL